MYFSQRVKFSKNNHVKVNNRYRGNLIPLIFVDPSAGIGQAKINFLAQPLSFVRLIH